MGNIKTLVTDRSVDEYIDSLTDERRKNDSKQLLEIFKQATGMKPKLWGASMVGYR